MSDQPGRGYSVERVQFLEGQVERLTTRIAEQDAFIGRMAAMIRVKAAEEASVAGPIASVRWEGTSDAYYGNMEAIHHEVALGAQQMAVQGVMQDVLEWEPPKRHLQVVETTESDQNQADSDGSEGL